MRLPASIRQPGTDAGPSDQKSRSSETPLTFEIGSNSDLVLESLLDLPHKEKIIFRMSVNPQTLIQRIELGTSNLQKRIAAVNSMCEAGYPCGLLIAPVMLVDGWKAMYTELLEQ